MSLSRVVDIISLVVTVTSLCVMTSRAYVTHIEQCEPIEIPRCRAMPYNLTRMPNLVHHSNQLNAALVFQKYEVLIDAQCSSVLLFLLCAVHVPICALTSTSQPVPPCRGLCERARAGCEPLMNAYDVSWPEFLNCSKLPVYEQEMCVTPEAIVKSDDDVSSCQCKRRKPTLKLLKKQNYDFALRGRVMTRHKLSDSQLQVTLNVSQVLFRGKVKVSSSNTTTLLVTSDCLCPRLRKGRDYLVLGHDDLQTGSLTLSDSSIATRWKHQLARTVKRWNRRLTARAKRRDVWKRRSRKHKSSNGRATSSDPWSSSTIRRASTKHRWRKHWTHHRDVTQDSWEKLDQSLLDGYTHGGRYYTKRLMGKYKLLHPTHYRSSE